MQNTCKLYKKYINPKRETFVTMVTLCNMCSFHICQTNIIKRGGIVEPLIARVSQNQGAQGSTPGYIPLYYVLLLYVCKYVYMDVAGLISSFG